jgi:uncharacterized repeat protein (TIGR03803 family)
MANSAQHQGSISNPIFRPATAALAIVIVFGLAMFAQSAQAQTFRVLHSFTGKADGGNPLSALTIDKAGNLYGTASTGGVLYGTVFRLKLKGSNWIFDLLYSFTGGIDASDPSGGVIFGPDGSLYGTTTYGGTGEGGAVFNLRPSATACKSVLCPWTETVLYSFQRGADGSNPGYGDLLFDQQGNIYGTTIFGGGRDGGVVYQLSPSGSGWTESVLHSFGGGSEGSGPYNGVIFDNAGNLYGTLSDGGPSDAGLVFQLVSSMGWTANILYPFARQGDGSTPRAGLIFDPSGNLYGATTVGGTGNGGTVFELSPTGDWTFSLLYSFTARGLGCGPAGTLVMDQAGSLFGTTMCNGTHGQGNIFKLTRTSGTWTYTSLYDFTGGNDGGAPTNSVSLDANGNLYGTASQGGANGYGVVWEITP